MPKIVPNLIAQPVSRGRGAPQWGAPQISGGDPSGIAREVQQAGQQIGATSEAIAQWQAMKDETKFTEYRTKVDQLSNAHLLEIGKLGYDDYEKQQGELESKYRSDVAKLREDMGIYSANADVFDLKTFSEIKQKELVHRTTMEAQHMAAVSEERINVVAAKVGQFGTAKEQRDYLVNDAIPEINIELEKRYPGDREAQQRARDDVMAGVFKERVYALINNDNYLEASAMLKDENVKRYYEEFTGDRVVIDAKTLGDLRELVGKEADKNVVARYISELSRQMWRTDGTPGMNWDQAEEQIRAWEDDPNGITYAQGLEIRKGLNSMYELKHREQTRIETETRELMENDLITAWKNNTLTYAMIDNHANIKLLSSEKREHYYRLVDKMNGSITTLDRKDPRYGKVWEQFRIAVAMNPGMDPAVLGSLKFEVDGEEFEVYNLEFTDMQKLFEDTIEHVADKTVLPSVIARVTNTNRLSKDEETRLTGLLSQIIFEANINVWDAANASVLNSEADALVKAMREGKVADDFAYAMYRAGELRSSRENVTDNIGATMALQGFPTEYYPERTAVVKSGALNYMQPNESVSRYKTENGWLAESWDGTSGVGYDIRGLRVQINQAGEGHLVDPNILAAFYEMARTNVDIQGLMAEGRAGHLGLTSVVSYNGRNLDPTNAQDEANILATLISRRLANGANMVGAIRTVLETEYGLSGDKLSGAVSQLSGIITNIRNKVSDRGREEDIQRTGALIMDSRGAVQGAYNGYYNR